MPVKTTPNKKSFGVALCRKNVNTGEYEILLVHRRCTYAFCDFVHGRYLHKPVSGRQRLIKTMLESMSVNELIDVMTYDFDKIWYRTWLCNGNEKANGMYDLYSKKKEVFYATFPNKESLEAIAPRIRRTEEMWSIPKGHQNNSSEYGLICAARELKEETGIDKRSYVFLDCKPIRDGYTGDDGVHYLNEFYIAIANPCIATLRDATYKYGATWDIMKEIDHIKWMSLAKVRTLDNYSRVLDVAERAIKEVKKYMKNSHVKDSRGKDIRGNGKFIPKQKHSDIDTFSNITAYGNAKGLCRKLIDMHKHSGHASMNSHASISGHTKGPLFTTYTRAICNDAGIASPNRSIEEELAALYAHKNNNRIIVSDAFAETFIGNPLKSKKRRLHLLMTIIDGGTGGDCFIKPLT